MEPKDEAARIARASNLVGVFERIDKIQTKDIQSECLSHVCHALNLVTISGSGLTLDELSQQFRAEKPCD